MNWQQLEDLFHAALERAPEERPGFVKAECVGDEEMLRKLQALLAAHDNAGSFIEQGAVAVEAKELAAEQEGTDAGQPVIGQTISHYRIIRRLGAGAMGEVYLAQDTTLRREVALKLLPAHFSDDAERLRRFEQEARAASALNHPNILTIFEIGNADSVRYIATEFIDGLTLRERIGGRPMNTDEALDMAIQIAGALAVAHAKGIVHRDIKPENIMTSRPGHLAQGETYVKVLDFGIAKLTEPQVPDTEMPTRMLVSTSAGVTMGTAPYMSPEQVRGDRVDARTDIWSLGAVLYEMLSGEQPFKGEKSQDVSAAILKDEPLPLPTHVPDGLARVVKKALGKERTDRYQTAGEMFAELRELQSAGTERSSFTTRSTSGAAYRTSAIRKRRGALLLITLLSVLVAAGAYGVYKFANKGGMPAVSFHEAKWTRLTTSGKVTRAAISPDGKYVVHVVDDAGRQSLRVRQVATQSNVEIAAPAPVTYESLTFTPDGNYIYYVLEAKDLRQPVLYYVSMFGGDPKRVPVKLDTATQDMPHRALVSFSPDGKRFAYSRSVSDKETALMIANADGTAEQKLLTHRAPEVCSWPSWSPDGKTIAYTVGNFDSNDMTVFEARVSDGGFKPLASRRWLRVGRMGWLADGSGLLILATAGKTSSHQIWHLSKLGGEAHPLTNNLNRYVDLSLTADSGTVATVEYGEQGNIWIVPSDDVARARQITSRVDLIEGSGGISWTLDGRIVYSSVADDARDIWIINTDGKNQKQLTSNARINNQQSVTPDGRYIFFLSDRTGAPHIWRMDLDGGDLKQITNGAGEQSPVGSPDGRWVVYRMVFGENTLWRVPVDGGEPERLTDKSADGAVAFSLDGQSIAYCTEEDGALRLVIMPFAGGRPLRTFDVPPTILGVAGVRWTPDGRDLAYTGTRDGVSNIWIQSLDGGQPKKLTDFKSDRIFAFDWSRDGKQLAVSRGGEMRDLVMISNFR
jgi:serine/threonine protein kinase/Tol biopolymer transport system component